MEVMDHLMADGRKLTKIIKTAKWGKSYQKKYLIYINSKQIRVSVSLEDEVIRLGKVWSFSKATFQN